ncbi:MAG: hypothetical protein JW737_06115 [Acidobacteria bacterium]|nr:hypothetical protein [Acidobacteriota bacterium]
MKRIFIIAIALSLALLAYGEEKKEDSFEVGARVQHDWGFYPSYDENIDINFGSFEETMEYRRLWAYGKGNFGENIEFKIEMSLEGGSPLPKDVYIIFKNLPFNITIGHFREPFGLEQLTSSNYITFMERAIPDMFTPTRNSGAMIDFTAFDNLLYVTGGAFRVANSIGDVESIDPTYDFTGRLAVRPLYKDDGKTMVHIGAAINYRDLGDYGNIKFQARPECHMIGAFIDSSGIAATSTTIFGFELASVFGPLSIQGEYMVANITSEERLDPSLSGYYIQASYWLTGEYRPYSLGSATFGRVKPNNDVFKEGGIGAIELAARYSVGDLEDETVYGGELKNFTIGINWHQTARTRLMLNYVISDQSYYGSIQIFQLRVQFDFALKK